jgi:hypothetical protein
MGLDILLGADNYTELQRNNYNASNQELSRTFCHFMGRRHEIEEEAELDQLGRLTGVDITPLYEMDNYLQPEDLALMLEHADSEEEKQEIQQRADNNEAAMANNIERVAATVDALLAKLAQIDDLPSKLVPDKYDRLGSEHYFTNFSQPGGNWIDNNLGQDLRNFKNFLDYAKSEGTTTVFFVYG